MSATNSISCANSRLVASTGGENTTTTTTTTTTSADQYLQQQAEAVEFDNSSKTAIAMAWPTRLSPRKSRQRSGGATDAEAGFRRAAPDEDPEEEDSPTRVLDYDNAVITSIVGRSSSSSSPSKPSSFRSGNGSRRDRCTKTKNKTYPSLTHSNIQQLQMQHQASPPTKKRTSISRKKKNAAVASAPNDATTRGAGGAATSSTGPAGATPDIFRLAPIHTAHSQSSRRSRQYFRSLPTLDETSSSETSSSGEREEDIVVAADCSSSKDDDEKQEEEGEALVAEQSPAGVVDAVTSTDTFTAPTTPVSSPVKKRQVSSSVHVDGSSPIRKLVLPTANATLPSAASSSSFGDDEISTPGSTIAAKPKKRTILERVADLRTKAEDLASRGEEEDALLLYKKALKLNRHETIRVKNQLAQVENKHPSALMSIASRLHEDWFAVGKSIAEIRYEMAILAERVGDYDRAISCCLEASGVYKRQHAFLEKHNKNAVVGSNGVNISALDVQQKVEEMKALLEKLHRAKDSYEERKLLHEDIIVLRRALSNCLGEGIASPRLAHDTEQRKLRVALEQQMIRALHLECKILGNDHPQVADTLSLMAAFELEMGDTRHAVEHLQQALTISQSSLGPKHPLTGELHLQMARLYASSEPVDEANALHYYEQSVQVFKASERNPRLVGSTLNEISVICIRQRNFDHAILLLNEALGSFQSSQEDNGTTVIHTDPVQIWRNLGECYSQQKDFAKASDAFLSALDLQRSARNVYDASVSEHRLGESPQPPPAYLVDDASIADTLRRLGKSYMGSGKHADALSVYAEALLIHRAAVVKSVNCGNSSAKPHQGRSMADTSLPDRQDQLAHTLFCIAEVREAVGDGNEALRIYSESMQLRLFSDAHRQEKRQNMVHCAMCLRGIGNVHLSKKEYESAQKVYEDALSYCEAHGTFVIIAHSHSYQLRCYKAVSHQSFLLLITITGVPGDHAIVLNIRQQIVKSERLVDQQRRRKELDKLKRRASREVILGQLDEAIDTLTQIMAERKVILKMLKDENADSSEEKLATAYTLKLFGEVLVKKGDFVNAERAFGDALKLFSRKKNGNSGGGRQQEQTLQEIKSSLKNVRSLRS